MPISLPPVAHRLARIILAERTTLCLMDLFIGFRNRWIYAGCTRWARSLDEKQAFGRANKHGAGVPLAEFQSCAAKYSFHQRRISFKRCILKSGGPCRLMP